MYPPPNPLGVQAVNNATDFIGKSFDFGSGSIPDILQAFFYMALSVGAILAVIRISWAGYLYVTGDIKPENKSKAKEVLQDAILGLIILLSVWAVLNTINPDILNKDPFRSLKSMSSGTAAP
ncbi:hypothetical protein EBR66_01940 [bacterium]|nr:hypothetical protein [bacterium]